MNRRITVRGIVIDDTKLLAVRLKPYKDHLKRDNSYWCLPGGGLEAGESAVDGVRREMLEETGVAATVGGLLYVQQFLHEPTNTEFLEFFFHITNAADYRQIDLAASSHGALEIEQIDFIDPTAVTVLPKFLASEPLGEVAAAGGPPKFFNYL